MASQPNPRLSPQEPHASPYCSDPNCQSCKELREMQEAIRLHKPLPQVRVLRVPALPLHFDPVAKRILSISYDQPLLWTRQQMLEQLGYNVVSAEGFVAAVEACEAPNVNFDLLILGHTIPAKDKERIISHFRQHCDSPILALLRPHEGAMLTADRSIEPEPEKLIAAVREILNT